MVYQFRLTNGNFKKTANFDENKTIGDIINYLENIYTKTTSNRIRLFRGKVFYIDPFDKYGMFEDKKSLQSIY